MSEVLEPLRCPFCGGQACARITFGAYVVGCVNCGAEGPRAQRATEGHADHHLALIEAWNNRIKEIPVNLSKRLVYNKQTKRIDVVRYLDGLVVDSFDPPQDCE